MNNGRLQDKADRIGGNKQMSDRPKPKKPPLTPLRWFFAILGGLIVTFTVVCTLYLLGPVSRSYGTDTWFLVLFFAGIPLMVGVLILLLALDRAPEESSGTHDREGGSDDRNTGA